MKSKSKGIDELIVDPLNYYLSQTNDDDNPIHLTHSHRRWRILIVRVSFNVGSLSLFFPRHPSQSQEAQSIENIFLSGHKSGKAPQLSQIVLEPPSSLRQNSVAMQCNALARSSNGSWSIPPQARPQRRQLAPRRHRRMNQ